MNYLVYAFRGEIILAKQLQFLFRPFFLNVHLVNFKIKYSERESRPVPCLYLR